MSVIDWSKAKDSDTHYDVLGRVFINFDSMHDYRKTLIPRPSAPGWSGEGLPPAGIECEFNHKGTRGEWVTCHVVGYHLGHLYGFCPDDEWFMERHDGCCHLRVDETVKFRPIRTPEQIAAEQREAAIKVMVKLCPYPGSECTRIDCEALYDAGLRFTDTEQSK